MAARDASLRRAAKQARVSVRRDNKSARKIVEARKLKTLEEAKRFVERWIETAAQYCRNAAFWQNQANAERALLVALLTEPEIVLRTKRRVAPAAWHVVADVLHSVSSVLRYAMPPERDPLDPEVKTKKTRKR
jgi:hypothetical protein